MGFMLIMRVQIHAWIMDAQSYSESPSLIVKMHCEGQFISLGSSSDRA